MLQMEQKISFSVPLTIAPHCSPDNEIVESEPIFYLIKHNKGENMLYIIKWIEMDEIYNYYPCLQLFSDINEARDFKSNKEDELANQESRMEELFDGKIISEIYLEEIQIEGVVPYSEFWKSLFKKFYVRKEDETKRNY